MKQTAAFCPEMDLKLIIIEVTDEKIDSVREKLKPSRNKLNITGDRGHCVS